MTTARPSLLDLHPIEVLLLVFLLSIDAIGRLINDPPRPFRRRAGSCGFTASGSPIYVLRSQSAAEDGARDTLAAFAAAAREINANPEALRRRQQHPAPPAV